VAGLWTFAEEMIRDRLIPEIRKCFASAEISFESDSNLIARIPSIQEEVGDVVIYDDGDEATVEIDKISHGHFGADWDEKLPSDESIAENVVDFLKALFSDQVLLYTNLNGRIAGWTRLDLLDDPISIKEDYRYFLWSKPYET